MAFKSLKLVKISSVRMIFTILIIGTIFLNIYFLKNDYFGMRAFSLTAEIIRDRYSTFGPMADQDVIEYSRGCRLPKDLICGCDTVKGCLDRYVVPNIVNYVITSGCEIIFQHLISIKASFIASCLFSNSLQAF